MPTFRATKRIGYQTDGKPAVGFKPGDEIDPATVPKATFAEWRRLKAVAEVKDDAPAPAPVPSE